MTETSMAPPSSVHANSDAINDDKPWLRAWSSAEIKNASNTWTLSSDAGLLLYLEGVSQRILSRTHEIEKQVDGLLRETQFTHTRVHNVFNEMMMLSNTQFIENRVYEDDVTAFGDADNVMENPITAVTPDSEEKTREQLEAEIIPKFTDSIGYGMNVMDKAFTIKSTITPSNDISDGDDDSLPDDYVAETVLTAKNVYSHRALPVIIGSRSFFENEDVGLCNSEESSEVLDESESDESDSSEESHYSDELLDSKRSRTSSRLNDTISSIEKNPAENEIDSGSDVGEPVVISSQPAVSDDRNMFDDDTVDNVQSDIFKASLEARLQISPKKKKRSSITSNRSRSSSKRSDHAVLESGHDPQDPFGTVTNSLFGSDSFFNQSKNATGSSGGGLFDDSDDDDTLFPNVKSKNIPVKATSPVGSDDNLFSDSEEEKSPLIKPRKRRVSSSGKKLPVGAVALFPDDISLQTNKDRNLSSTSLHRSNSESSQLVSSSADISHNKAKQEESTPRKKSLFDDDGGDDDNGLFNTSSFSTVEVTRKNSNKQSLLFGNDLDDNEDDLFSSPSASSGKGLNQKKASLFDDDAPLFETEISKTLVSGVTLFDDGETSGDIFKASSPKPKNKGLFNDESDDDKGSSLFDGPSKSDADVAYVSSKSDRKLSSKIEDNVVGDEKVKSVNETLFNEIGNDNYIFNSKSKSPVKSRAFTKKSILFGSDDDDENDDIFGGGKSKDDGGSDEAKKSPSVTTVKSITPEKSAISTKKLSNLFYSDDDENDDIFGCGKSKDDGGSDEAKKSPSVATVKSITSEKSALETDAKMQSSLFGNDDASDEVNSPEKSTVSMKKSSILFSSDENDNAVLKGNKTGDKSAELGKSMATIDPARMLPGKVPLAPAAAASILKSVSPGESAFSADKSSDELKKSMASKMIHGSVSPTKPTQKSSGLVGNNNVNDDIISDAKDKVTTTVHKSNEMKKSMAKIDPTRMMPGHAPSKKPTVSASSSINLDAPLSTIKTLESVTKRRATGRKGRRPPSCYRVVGSTTESTASTEVNNTLDDIVFNNMATSGDKDQTAVVSTIETTDSTENMKREVKEKSEREAKEKNEREAKERSEREAKEKSDGEAKEKSEREAKERSEREAKEKSEREAKERSEREAKEKSEREAKERSEREAKEKSDREAKEKSEREAKERNEREAKEKSEREAKEKSDREAKEKSEREAKERSEREAKEKSEREAKKDISVFRSKGIFGDDDIDYDIFGDSSNMNQSTRHSTKETAIITESVDARNFRSTDAKLSVAIASEPPSIFNEDDDILNTTSRNKDIHNIFETDDSASADIFSAPNKVLKDSSDTVESNEHKHQKSSKRSPLFGDDDGEIFDGSSSKNSPKAKKASLSTTTSLFGDNDDSIFSSSPNNSSNKKPSMKKSSSAAGNKKISIFDDVENIFDPLS